MPADNKPIETTIARSTNVPLASGYFAISKQNAEPDAQGAHGEGDGICGPSPVEIRVIRDGHCRPGAVYEVWTKRTIYEFDQSLICISARDAETNVPRLQSKCLGAQLFGGRLFRDRRMDMSSPVPAIGHNAVLSSESTTMVTSPVTRVIMYVCHWSSLVPAIAESER